MYFIIAPRIVVNDYCRQLQLTVLPLFSLCYYRNYYCYHSFYHHYYYIRTHRYLCTEVVCFCKSRVLFGRFTVTHALIVNERYFNRPQQCLLIAFKRTSLERTHTRSVTEFFVCDMTYCVVPVHALHGHERQIINNVILLASGIHKRVEPRTRRDRLDSV